MSKEYKIIYIITFVVQGFIYFIMFSLNLHTYLTFVLQLVTHHFWWENICSQLSIHDKFAFLLFLLQQRGQTGDKHSRHIK